MKGIWRRTSIADYASAESRWETLLDVDKLAAEEQEDWVYKGRNCSPTLNRCLISLSRGGGDAVTIREYDLGTKTFVKDGFKLDEAKSYASFVDDNTIIFATNFGGGTMTGSGYPRIVKLWTRGTPIASAKPVFDGKQNDVTVDPLVFRLRDQRTADHRRGHQLLRCGLLHRGPRRLDDQGRPAAGRRVAGRARRPADRHAARRLESRQRAEGCADRCSDQGRQGCEGRYSLCAGSARVCRRSLGRPRRCLCRGLRQCRGQIHAFRLDPDKNTWTDKTLALPPGGSVHIVSTNDYGPEAQFRYENFLTPVTLYAELG